MRGVAGSYDGREVVVERHRRRPPMPPISRGAATLIRDRAVIILAWNGFRVPEIAVTLGVTAQAIYHRMAILREMGWDGH